MSRRFRHAAAFLFIVCASLAAAASGGADRHVWPFADPVGAERAFTPGDPPSVPSACRHLPPGNPYAAPTVTVDAISSDAVNVGAGSNHGCVTPQNEPAIAVDPRDPRTVVIGSNDYRMCCDRLLHNDGGGLVYVSHDGGRTFAQVLAPGLTSVTGGTGPFSLVDSAGDPALAFGPDGTLYYANIAFSRTSPVSLIAVSTSRDGGDHWSRPHMVAGVNSAGLFLDKDWIAVGPGGGVYVTFTAFVLSPSSGLYLASPIYMASHTPHSRWRISRVSNDRWPFDQGAVPQVAPDGRLYIAFEAGDRFSGHDQIAVATRGRGGFTVRPVGRVHDAYSCYPLNDDHRSVLSGEAFRLVSLPSFAIDPVTGRQAIVWADNPSCHPDRTASVIALVTGDGHGGYTPRVTLPGGGERVFPAVAFFNDVAAVSYYTRSYATDGVSLDYALRTSVDGFTREARITEQSSDPGVQFDGAFVGDYTAAAFGADGVLHVAWTDFRGSPAAGTQPNQDIYTAAIPG